MLIFFFFFFQAEDGIRDKLVTGVQTCALPICPTWTDSILRAPRGTLRVRPCRAASGRAPPRRRARARAVRAPRGRHWRSKRETPPRRGTRTPSRRGGRRLRSRGSAPPRLPKTPVGVPPRKRR